MTRTQAAATPIDSIKTILVATDFSHNALAALDWAVGLAAIHKAHVVIVHAVETELPALAVPPGPIAQKVRDSLNEAHKLATDRQVIASGEYHIDKPWKVVPAVAAKISADLIVLGARGRTDYAGKLLGSTADRIIRTTSVPVIVVRDDARRPFAIQSVLMASDFSEESARAMSMIVRLVRNSKEIVRLLLLHVVELHIPYPIPFSASYPEAAYPPLPSPEYWNDIEQQAARTLEGLAGPMRCDRLSVEVKTVRGFPGEEIVREAASFNAQLIAIGTQGRTGLNRFFMGSVAEWVLHHAQCPVLTVRKPDPADPISLSAGM